MVPRDGIKRGALKLARLRKIAMVIPSERFTAKQLILIKFLGKLDPRFKHEHAMRLHLRRYLDLKSYHTLEEPW